jgi:hypothetical protein
MISIDFREETFNSPVHTHDFLEMLYIYSGTAVHHYKNEKSPVKKGDYVFIDFNSEHSVKNKSDNFKAITCTFVPEFIDSSLFGCTSIADVLKNYNINLFSGSLEDFSLFNDNSEKILQILMEMFDDNKGNTVNDQRRSHDGKSVKMGFKEIIKRNSDQSSGKNTDHNAKPKAPGLLFFGLTLLTRPRIELTEIQHNNGKDRTQLNGNKEEFVELGRDSILHSEKLIHKDHMSRTTDGKPLRDTLDNADYHSR